MIRIERKDTAQTLLAIKDLEEVSQRGNSYNTENVNRALKAVFMENVTSVKINTLHRIRLNI